MRFEKKRDFKNLSSLGSATLGISLLMMGCGGKSYRSNASYTTQYTASYSSSYPEGNNTGTVPMGNTSPTTTSSGSSGSTSTQKGVAPLSFRVGATGYTSTTITVQAAKTLKVKFTPQTQDEMIAGTQQSPQYSGLGVYITAGSSTQATPLLYNGLFGGNAQSATLDFSQAILSNNSCGTNTSCRNTITITISKPNYDHWCIQYGAYCPWSQVSSGHPWHGMLSVQTDDTDPL